MTLVVLLMLVAVPTFSKAFVHLRSGYYHSVVHVNAQIVDTARYKTPYYKAMDAWNNATNRIRCGNANASSNVVCMVGWNQDWLGRYLPQAYKPNGRASRFIIEINDNQIRYTSDRFKQSVIAHEMGHALCLGHNANITSIMNQNRNREFVIVPNSDDIRGVNYAY